MPKSSRIFILFFVAVVTALVAFFARFLAPVGVVPYDLKRWGLLIAVGVIIACLQQKSRVAAPPNYLLSSGIGLFLFSMFLSTYWAGDSWYQFVEVFFWVWVIGAFFSVYSVVEDVKDQIDVIYCFCVIWVLASFSFSLLIVFLYLIYLSGNEKVFEPLIISGFANIRYWSHLATIIIPLLPVVILLSNEKNHKLFKIFSYLVGGVFWWVIFLTAAKGTILSMAFGASLIAIMFRHQVVPWFRATSVTLALGISAYIVLSVIVPAVMHEGVILKGVGHTLSVRLELWAEAWHRSVQFFPFGTGSMSWVLSPSQVLNEKLNQRYAHPHNMYLLFAAEYGWLAVIGIFALGLEVVRRLLVTSSELRAKPSFPKAAVVVSFSISVIGSVIHAGASMVFLSPASMMFAVFTVPIFWLLTKDTKREKSSSFRGKRGGVIFNWVVVLLIGLYACYAAFVYQFYGDMKRDEPLYRETIYNGFAPRFWFHGEFPRLSTTEDHQVKR